MRDDIQAETLAYYNQQADSFAAQTVVLDLAPLYDRFLHHVQKGARLLDAGCGVGRDALAFAERGYQVVAFDASEAMVRIGRARIGSRATVHLKRFDAVTWHEEFDGIWSCASLLHVPSSEFRRVVSRLADTLRIGGAWYMSFKLGHGERVSEGRLFSNHTEVSLRGALADQPVEVVDMWTSADLRPNRASEHWLNVIATRVV